MFSIRNFSLSACFLGLLRFCFPRERTGGTIHLVSASMTWGKTIAASITFNLLIGVNLSPGVPKLEKNWLQKSVPNVEQNRNNYAGNTHHSVCCCSLDQRLIENEQ